MRFTAPIKCFYRAYVRARSSTKLLIIALSVVYKARNPPSINLPNDLGNHSNAKSYRFVVAKIMINRTNLFRFVTTPAKMTIRTNLFDSSDGND